MIGHSKMCLFGLAAMISLTLNGCSVRNADCFLRWKEWLQTLKSAVQDVAEQTLTEQDILPNPFAPEPDGSEPALPEEDGQPPEFVDSQGEDAETYYERRSEVLDVAEADVSVSVHTEAEASANFIERGFDQYPVTTDYTLQGEYIGETEISSDSDEKHPVYETYYMGGEEIIWVIYEINGRIIADPVSYNLESGRNVRLVIAENTTLISYDGTMNRFYETVPDASVLFLKTVPRIDAQMLNYLTKGALDSLWE